MDDMTFFDGPCIPVISERVRDAAALGRPLYARSVSDQHKSGLYGILQKGMLTERHWDYFMGKKSTSPKLDAEERAYIRALFALRDDDDSVCSANYMAESDEAEWTLFCAAVDGNAEAIEHYAMLRTKYADWDRLRGDYEG